MNVKCKRLAFGQVQCLNNICQHTMPHRVVWSRFPFAVLGMHSASHGCNDSLSGSLPDNNLHTLTTSAETNKSHMQHATENGAAAQVFLGSMEVPYHV